MSIEDPGPDYPPAAVPAAGPLICWWCQQPAPPPMVCNDLQTIGMHGTCAQAVAAFLNPEAAAAPPPLDLERGCIECGARVVVGFTIERRPGPFCAPCWKALKAHVRSLDESDAEVERLRSLHAAPPVPDRHVPTCVPDADKAWIWAFMEADDQASFCQAEGAKSPEHPDFKMKFWCFWNAHDNLCASCADFQHIYLANIHEELVARHAAPEAARLRDAERAVEQLAGDVRAACADYGEEKHKREQLEGALRALVAQFDRWSAYATQQANDARDDGEERREAHQRGWAEAFKGASDALAALLPASVKET